MKCMTDKFINNILLVVIAEILRQQAKIGQYTSFNMKNIIFKNKNLFWFKCRIVWILSI